MTTATLIVGQANQSTAEADALVQGAPYVNALTTGMPLDDERLTAAVVQFDLCAAVHLTGAWQPRAGAGRADPYYGVYDDSAA